MSIIRKSPVKDWTKNGDVFRMYVEHVISSLNSSSRFKIKIIVNAFSDVSVFINTSEYSGIFIN